MAPPPDTSAPLRRKVGFAGIGVGAAGLICGGITGGMALGKHSSIANRCPAGHCPAGSEGQNQSDISSYNTLGAISTAGFVAGGVLAVTGIILVATAPSAPQKVGILPVIGPGYLGAQGRF